MFVLSCALVPTVGACRRRTGITSTGTLREVLPGFPGTSDPRKAGYLRGIQVIRKLRLPTFFREPCTIFPSPFVESFTAAEIFTAPLASSTPRNPGYSTHSEDSRPLAGGLLFSLVLPPPGDLPSPAELFQSPFPVIPTVQVQPATLASGPLDFSGVYDPAPTYSRKLPPSRPCKGIPSVISRSRSSGSIFPGSSTSSKLFNLVGPFNYFVPTTPEGPLPLTPGKWYQTLLGIATPAKIVPISMDGLAA